MTIYGTTDLEQTCWKILLGMEGGQGALTGAT